MAELTTDDGSTASPEAIRRFEERNNAVSDQTTDHLSGAVNALADLQSLGEGERKRYHDDLLLEVKTLEPFFATYYEEKGRSEERERLLGDEAVRAGAYAQYDWLNPTAPNTQESAEERDGYLEPFKAGLLAALGQEKES